MPPAPVIIWGTAHTIKKTTTLAFAYPPQLLAPTVDSNKTEALGRCLWCWDEAAPACRLGMAAPQAMQSTISVDDWRWA